MELKFFVIILSIGGTVLLYCLSTLSQPQSIDLSDIPKFENKQVIVEGIITAYHTTSYNGQIIEIKDRNAKKNTTTTLFVEEEIGVEYGDAVRATGTVQKYKGDWEIVVNNKRFVTIIQKWQNISYPIWQLAEHPERYVGINVNATGWIDRIHNDFFYLVDSEGKYTIVVLCDVSRLPPLSQGDEVYVAAQFMYDAENLRYVLKTSGETSSIFPVEGK